MSKNSILEVLQKSKGYDIALFTTFNFEIEFFERFIKNALFSNKTKKISVFVDAQELNKAIAKEGDVLNIGHHYVVNPIEMEGSFHPKVVLLLGKKKARLVVSSCNLTTSGYTINNEAFYSYDCDESTGNNKQMILKAIDFFCRLNDLSFHSDDALFLEIRGYKNVYDSFTEGDAEAVFAHNLVDSLVEQIKDSVIEANHIDVAVPYYDNECFAIKELSKIFSSANITLFLQNRMARISIEKINQLPSVRTFPFAGFGDRKNNNFYHGKVFRFLNGDESHVMFGSANCTSSALIKSFKTGGNIEAVVIHKSDANESLEFFENFNHYTGEEIEYDLMKYESGESGNFFFHNGVLSDELHLYLGVVKIPKTLKIYLDKEECNFTVSGKTIDVVPDLEVLTRRNTILLDVEYEGRTERVICWYTDLSEVQYTRSPSLPKYDLEDVSLDPNSSKYIAEQMLISNALALNIDEYMSDIHTMRMLQRDRDSLIDDEEETEDGIIDYVIPEDTNYVYHSKLFKKLNEIKQYYYDSYFKLFLTSTERAKIKVERHNDATTKDRKPTTDEKRFRRFINKRIKGFIDKELVDVVNYDHYIACATIFLSIFDKYSIIEPVKGLFDDEQTALFRITIAENVLELTYRENKDIKPALLLTLKVLLSNRFFANFDWEMAHSTRKRSRDLLLKFTDSETSAFRKRVKTMVTKITKDDIKCNDIDSADFIDDLYGYYTLEHINSIMRQDFSREIKCYVDDANQYVAKIVVVTSSIGNISKYENCKTVTELRNYNKYKKRWKKILIEFVPNRDEFLSSEVHEYDLEQKTFRTISYYRDGKRSYGRTTYIF